MIGTLLIALETQSRPNDYDHAMISQVMAGWVTLCEARTVLDRRRKDRKRAVAWQDKYNAKKRSQRID